MSAQVISRTENEFTVQITRSLQSLDAGLRGNPAATAKRRWCLATRRGCGSLIPMALRS